MRRKRKKRKIIPVVLLAVLLIGEFLFVAYRFYQIRSGRTEAPEAAKSEPAEPEAILKEYYEFVGQRKYGKMYGTLTEECRERVSEEEFISRNQNIYEGIEASDISLEIIGREDREDTVVLSHKITMETAAGEISFENEAAFREEESSAGYRLCWDDSMIFPALERTDKIRVLEQKAKRGKILDRSGRILAGPGTATMVGLVPGKMSGDNSGELDRLAKLLGISPESIEKKLGAKWVKDDSFVPIKMIKKLTALEELRYEVSEETVQKQELETELLKIPGIMLTDTEIREYPLGKAASHLVGYVQKVTAEDLEKYPEAGYDADSMIGRSGMESLFEKELRGQDGCQIVMIDKQGRTKSVLASKMKIDGQDVRLTIDSELQEVLYREFEEDESCSVAMNPYTGEVLALVSTPSFDSNDFIYGLSEQQWEALNEDSKTPLYNRFRQKICPGSSFKPIIAAIGLKTGAIDPNEDFGNEGLSWQKDKSWGGYYVTTLHAYAPATLENALICSDNIYFAKAALKIGKEKLEKELDNLGFNEKLPFEISVAASQYANSGEIESEIQLADSGYGQGQILVNPVHLAALYTGFVNQGNVLLPRLVYQEQANANIWINGAYAPEDAERIKAAMEQVVCSPDGTAHGAYDGKTALAAKTGTAEIKRSKDDSAGTELGWLGIFTLEPDISKPVLLMTMVEDVKGRGGSGYVVKKARAVLDEWFAPENDKNTAV